MLTQDITRHMPERKQKMRTMRPRKIRIKSTGFDSILVTLVHDKRVAKRKERRETVAFRKALLVLKLRELRKQ